MQRRAFLTGLAAAITAPAIVRAGVLMPIKAEPVLRAYLLPQTSLSLQSMTREAILLFRNKNLFLKEIERQYADLVPALDYRGRPYGWGDQVRIHLPLGAAA